MGYVSNALFPFWRLDAKGGEVVLLDSLRGICMGRTQACAFYHSCCACVPLCYLELLFASYVLRTMDVIYVSVRHMDFLLCMVEPTLVCYGLYGCYLHLYAQGMVLSLDSTYIVICPFGKCGCFHIMLLFG
jgi:hypothetical protein